MNSSEILLLHRAYRNAGDYLIFERARRLIELHCPQMQITVGEAWRPLNEQMPLDRLNGFAAIIICGGPGYQARMYPKVYPLVADLSTLTAPVIPLALGSFVFPGTARQLAGFRFSGPSRGMLDHLRARTPYFGARDELTASLLRRNGYPSVIMTGDPAWYDLDCLEGEVRRPSSIASIAFTPPADRYYFAQAVHLLGSLRRSYPQAEIQVVFHRELQDVFVTEAERHGCTIVKIDSAGDFALYDSVSIHLGYRVHAHLYCTSRGTVSYLLAEDSRGAGVLGSLGNLGVLAHPMVRRVSAWTRTVSGLASATGERKRLAPFFDRLVRNDYMRPGPEILQQIATDTESGFARHVAARRIILDTYPSMIRMIGSIPQPAVL